MDKERGRELERDRGDEKERDTQTKLNTRPSLFFFFLFQKKRDGRQVCGGGAMK
jgi:hypothetical protein